MTLALALAGCGSIGQGSTIQSLEIRLAATGSTTAPVTLHQCLRDQLIVVARFTDGTTADFSLRAHWTSSDDSIVRVSNGDIPLSVLSGGVFTDSTFPHRAGTIIPQAASGTATITASFVGLSASMPVQIATADFKVAALAPGVNPQLQPPAPQFLGPGTTTRFGFYVRDSVGKTVTSSTLNSLDTLLNPVQWTFVNGELQARDPDVAGDFDKYAVPDATDPVAVINVVTGLVTAKRPDLAMDYQVQATTSLCPTDPLFRPTADLRVVPFALANALELAHEDGFIAPGVPGNGEFVSGTNEVLKVIAHLDSTDDAVDNPDQTQDLSTQVDFSITHTTPCVEGERSCVCETGGVNCTKQVISLAGSVVQTLWSDESAGADVHACFTAVDATHADDCEEIAESEPGFTSNTLSLQAIAVDLSGTGATLWVEPAAPLAERAFTYPGRQFEAYGEFTALDGATPFAGGTSPTGTQKITRLVGWTTRPQGSTTEFSEVGFVGNLGDGFFNPLGAFNYLKDVTANTPVDISITPRSPLGSIEPPATPTSFTICPSVGGTCP